MLFVHRGDGLLGWGTYARIPVAAPDRFRSAEQALRELFDGFRVDDEVGLPGTGPVAFGAFTFDPSAAGSVLIVPRVIVGRRRGRAWRTTINPAGPSVEQPSAVTAPAVPGRVAEAAEPAPPGSADRVRYEGSTMSELAWVAAVDRAVTELRSGVARKVVLARDRRVWSRQPFDVRRLVRHLAARFPECQTFAIDGLVGASPEVLVERRGRRVRSLVLAGTAPRHDDPVVDEATAARLAASEKDLREHIYAVESVADALRPIAVCVEVDAEPHILRLANVMHLATRVTAQLRQEQSALAVAGLLHPSAAVCGTPTEQAQEIIRRLEGMDRARYSGPVGWVDNRGDGPWAIALRCAELDGSRGRLFAGAGIVEGSLPEAELEETRLKLRAMQTAFES